MMAICNHCNHEMLTGQGCRPHCVRYPDGLVLDPIPYGTVEQAGDGEAEGHSGGPCHDCGVLPCGWHHLGCEVERCPRCMWQLIGCTCLDLPPGGRARSSARTSSLRAIR